MPYFSKMWAFNMPHSSKREGIGICPILVQWRADRSVYSPSEVRCDIPVKHLLPSGMVNPTAVMRSLWHPTIHR